MTPANDRIPWSHRVLFWAIALGGAAFDLGTKLYVFAWLGEPGARGPYPLVRNVLELHTNYNSGALWGLASTMPHSSQMFAVLSVVASVAIYYYLFHLGAAKNLPLTVALGLIMAGALGNCYDRFRLGHVRDFVHFHVDSINFNCAIFNFADNMLVIGACLLMLLALRPEPAAEPRAKSASLEAAGES